MPAERTSILSQRSELLREVLGPEVDTRTAAVLLRRNGYSLDRAAEAYYAGDAEDLWNVDGGLVDSEDEIAVFEREILGHHASGGRRDRPGAGGAAAGPEAPKLPHLAALADGADGLGFLSLLPATCAVCFDVVPRSAHVEFKCRHGMCVGCLDEWKKECRCYAGRCDHCRTGMAQCPVCRRPTHVRADTPLARSLHRSWLGGAAAGAAAPPRRAPRPFRAGTVPLRSVPPLHRFGPDWTFVNPFAVLPRSSQSPYASPPRTPREQEGERDALPLALPLQQVEAGASAETRAQVQAALLTLMSATRPTPPPPPPAAAAATAKGSATVLRTRGEARHGARGSAASCIYTRTGCGCSPPAVPPSATLSSVRFFSARM